jgi:hypothetical protein
MADEPRKPEAIVGLVVARLVTEAGITEEQARELVMLLGASNWTSLMREARLLNRRR